jgi:hypothetical protein
MTIRFGERFARQDCILRTRQGAAQCLRPLPSPSTSHSHPRLTQSSRLCRRAADPGAQPQCLRPLPSPSTSHSHPRLTQSSRLCRRAADPGAQPQCLRPLPSPSTSHSHPRLTQSSRLCRRAADPRDAPRGARCAWSGCRWRRRACRTHAEAEAEAAEVGTRTTRAPSWCTATRRSTAASARAAPPTEEVGKRG